MMRVLLATGVLLLLPGPALAGAQNAGPTCSVPAGQQSGGLVHDHSATIPFTCSDPDGDALVVSVSTPEHGGTVDVSHVNDINRTVTFTPALHYVGPDSFTVTADDGLAQTGFSVVRNITNAAPCGGMPSAYEQAHFRGETRLVSPCVDKDDDPVTLSVVAGPTYGTVTLAGSAPEIVYTANGQGGRKTDVIKLSASDGIATEEATLNIQATNADPVCEASRIVMVPYNAPARIPAICSDPDGDPLTLTAALAPTYDPGTLDVSGLGGSGPFVLYTSGRTLDGYDSGFTVQASDGGGGAVGQTMYGTRVIIGSRPPDPVVVRKGPVVTIPATNKTLTASMSGAVAFELGPWAEDGAGELRLKTGSTLLGKKPFSAVKGQTTTVKISLTKKNRALLKRLKRLRVTATIKVNGRGGRTTETFAFTLKAPRR